MKNEIPNFWTEIHQQYESNTKIVECGYKELRMRKVTYIHTYIHNS